MSLIFAKPHKLFEASLREDEEILWIGEPKSKLWWLSLKRLFLLLLGIVGVVVIVSFFLYFADLCLNILFLSPDSAKRIYYIDENIFVLGLSFFLALLYVISHLLKVFIKTLVKILETALRKKYYAITNQRVLIYEYAAVKAYSLILMADAIKHKPKRGRTTITLYDKTSYTGKMPKPIAVLNNLAEKDAEKAYKLLKDAREDSFLDRISELEQRQS